MRIHIAIATTGRPTILQQVVKRLTKQTRPANGILVVGATDADVAGLKALDHGIEVMITDKGLSRQRNAALDRLESKSDVVVFFDDDFVPAHDYLHSLEKLLRARPQVVGATGRLIADGAHSQPLTFEDAERRLDQLAERPRPFHREVASLYGCNMAFRVDVARGMRFDENLPFYSWWEDVDFTRQLTRFGSLRCTSQLTGVHLGARSGKTSGKRLGYSQVANIVYLRRKGTVPAFVGEQQMLRNVVANAVKSVWPEHDIDRRGRLVGNFLAFADLARGRIDPHRIEKL